MNKKDRLKKIEELYELKIIQCCEDDETNMLPELASIGNYLKGNSMVAEKEKSTLEEDIRKKVKDAQKRRDSNV